MQKIDIKLLSFYIQPKILKLRVYLLHKTLKRKFKPHGEKRRPKSNKWLDGHPTNPILNHFKHQISHKNQK